MSQTNAQLLADSLGTASTGTVPIGGIILWSGSTGSIPNGWALCNGSNGTPNLQDRFVVGAGSGYAVDATGGNKNAILVGHSHGITEPNNGQGHQHAYSDIYPILGSNRFGDESQALFQDNIARTPNTFFSTTGISINPNGLNAAGGANSGITGIDANLPPYYALCYIIRKE